VNGAVNVAFGSKVHNRSWLMFGKQAVEQRCIAEYRLAEQVPGIVCRDFRVLRLPAYVSLSKLRTDSSD
jgi:hypothetical protein